MNIDTPLMAEAQEGVVFANSNVPEPPARHTYKDIAYHEVLGPYGEPLLVAFGNVPLADWLEVVNDYYAKAPAEAGLGEQPWDPNDPDKVVAALDRLHYHRVAVVLHEGSQETPFTVRWDTEGITPITVWVVHFEAQPEED